MITGAVFMSVREKKIQLKKQKIRLKYDPVIEV